MIIRCGGMFDGEGFASNVEVTVEGGVITAVTSGPTSHVTGVEGSETSHDEVVDFGAEAMLLPGFVDAHQHLTWNCSPDPVSWLTTATDEDLLRTARTNARTALGSGVTTVRDLGDRGYVTLALRDETS